MNKIKIIVLLGIIMIFVAGCVSTKYLPPVQSNIQNEKIYDVSYDKLWAASVKVFADNLWDIRTIEKASGIIAGERVYDFGLKMDCGSYEITYPGNSGAEGKKEIVKGLNETILKYNFYVKNISENQSSLKINLTGTGHQLIYLPPPMLFAPPTQSIKYYNCVSNGVLEKSTFKSIEDNLSLKE